MVSRELLDILCCPETKQDVTYDDGEIVKKINVAIKNGEVKNRAGEVVKEPVQAVIIREDREYIYPVRMDIPIMLIDEAIPFKKFEQ